MARVETQEFAQSYAVLGVRYAAGEWHGDSRPTSALDVGIVAYLTAHLAANGSVCAWCGDIVSVGDVVECAHIYPQGSHRLGRVQGNMAAVHKACNRMDGAGIVPASAVIRQDVVALTWPTRADLTKLGESTMAARRASAASVRAARYGH